MHSLQCGAARLNAKVMGLWKKRVELVAGMDVITNEVRGIAVEAVSIMDEIEKEV